MKLAIAGKGGVGKSTIAAALALLLSRRGRKVLALDADPDANLASALGVSLETQKNIVPIARQKALIEERTGAKVKSYGQIFRLNPEVSDIANDYALKHNGVALLVLGAIEDGGGGCACPENVLIKALVADLILNKDEALVMDFEAGIEHLGRATAEGVNAMLVVVEPSAWSVGCARKIFAMACEIGIKDVRVIANKVASPDDERFVAEALPGKKIIGSIPFSQEIRSATCDGKSVLDGLGPDLIGRFEGIIETLERTL